MVTKSPTRTSRQHRSATIQWIAIGVAIALGILASFVFFGDDNGRGGGGGGHSGAATVQSTEL